MQNLVHQKVINPLAGNVICVDDRSKEKTIKCEGTGGTRLQENKAAQAGETLAELYESYEAGLQRFARNLTADSDWADDLVAETMFKALSNLALLTPLNEPQRKSWLYRVLKNKFLDDLRSRKREKRLVEQLIWIELEPGAEDVQLPLREDIPAHHRKVLYMRYEQGLTSEEISRKMGVPSATVRSRLRLAVQWIKNHQDEGV
jgi:RNA polymerase sigma-70 factor, ECF subfamily